MIQFIHAIGKELFITHTAISMGGCGRIVYGYNLEILEKRWNLGITDESDINYKFDNIEEIKKFLKTVE